MILCCRFANQETKTIGELCCLNVGVCSTTQAIFAKLNQFIGNHGFDLMKYKAVATNGTATMQSTTNGVVRKVKNVSLGCVSTCFLGESFGHRPKFFEMTEKRRSLWPEYHFQIQNLKMTEMSPRK